jgi:predicted Rossmann fold nucleotide-binding protein DprA/Smf involved in DNA uptake
MPAEKIDLVEMAVKDWANGKLTSNQAMINITIIVGSRAVSPECTRWAESILSKGAEDGS